MKNYLILLGLILYSFSAFAIPFRCLSIEKHENGNPIVNLKINAKRDYVDTRNRVWSSYYLGFSPATNLPFSRFTASGQGDANQQSISLTLIERDFIIGTLTAKRERGSHIMNGILNLRKIKSGDIKIECVKE